MEDAGAETGTLEQDSEQHVLRPGIVFTSLEECELERTARPWREVSRNVRRRLALPQSDPNGRAQALGIDVETREQASGCAFGR